MENNRVVTHSEVRQIFNDTYNNFYLKWKDIQNDSDFKQLWDDAKEINRKYKECELCKSMLLNLCNIIEQEFKQRESAE